MAALSYRQVLEDYDRSTATGDSRTLPQYARDMNSLYGNDMYSEGERDGWWTRASTRADQYLENSVVGDAFGALGGAAGSLFGREDQGREIGRQAPRAFLNMAPLVAAEIASGGTATPLVAPAMATALGLAGTGLAFGGHTYAQTGSARNAVFSGATAMLLPGLGKVGGDLGLALAQSPLARGLLTDAGEASGQFGNRAVGDFVSRRIATSMPEFLSQYGGSQAAMFGGSVLSAKLQNPQEDVLSKDFVTDFLLGQIPFTALDVYHGARTLGRGLPAREAVAGFTRPEEITKLGVPLTPDIGTPEEQANLQAVLQGHDEIAQSDLKSGAEKSAALLGLTRTVDDPKGAAALRAATSSSPDIHVKGWTKGDNRIVVDDHSGLTNLPDHNTMFFDPDAVKNMQATADGEVSFTIPAKNIRPAEKGLTKPYRDPNAQDLPPQANPPGTVPFGNVFHQQVEHDPFFTEDGKNEGFTEVPSPKEDKTQYGQSLGVHDIFAQIRKTQPFSPEEKATVVRMGASIEAFHGTPHKVPSFSLEHVGSGEGAQVYSYGLYFAGHPEVAKSYLGAGKDYGTNVDSHVRALKSNFNGVEGAKEFNDQKLSELRADPNAKPEDIAFREKVANALNTGQGEGNLYKVSIEATHDDLLDWDKPLGEQSPKVKEGLTKLGILPAHKKDVLGLAQEILPKDKESAERFRQAGILGVRYLDQGSREVTSFATELLDLEAFIRVWKGKKGKEQEVKDAENKLSALKKEKEKGKTYNYVLFDDSKIKITHENGKPVGGEERAQALDVVNIPKSHNAEEGLFSGEQEQIKEAVHAFDMAEQREKEKKTLASRRRTPEEDASIASKDGVEKRVASGLSPTQAVEHASLEVLSHDTDYAMLDQNVQKEVVRSKTRAKYEGREKTQFTDEVVAPNEKGEHTIFPSRADAMEWVDEHASSQQRDPEDFSIIDAGKNAEGVRKGFTVREKANRKFSLDIEDSGGHERLGADTQAAHDEEELQRTDESVAPSPVSSNTAILQLMKELGEWTPKQYADATGVDFPAAQDTIRDAKSALDQVAKNKIPTQKEQDALKAVRAQHLRLRSYDLGSEVPPDLNLVREMGISHGDYLPAFDWYAKNHPIDFMSSLFLDLKRLAKDSLNRIQWTKDFAPGWHYLAEENGLPPEINVPHLPTSRDPDEVLGWVGMLAHEITHHITKDLASRTDDAAVEFRKTLDEISTELRKSKLIPKEVRNAIEEARKTNVYSQHVSGDIKIQDWFDTRVSEKNKPFIGIFYGLLNSDEFVSQVFGDRNFTNLLAQTKRVVNKTFTERLMDRFARAWTTLTGLKAGHENALAEILTKFADYLGKPKDYNTMDLIRDRLISHGVRPDALASRVFTIKNMLRTGSLDESVKGWKREHENGLLPVTAEYADPAFTLDLPPLAIRKAVLDLPPEAVPAHDDLSLRLSQDLDVVRSALKESDLLAPEGLAKNILRVQQMRQGIRQYQRAQERWNNIDNFDGGGEWRQRIAGRLRGIDTPRPSDLTGNHDIALELLGLTRPMTAMESAADVRARTSIDLMKRGKMGELKSFLEKNFLLDQHFAQIYRAHAARHDALQTALASAFEKAQILATAYGFDPKNSGKVSDAVVKNNVEVTTNARLNEVASNVHRLANVLQQGGQDASWTHPDIQALISHLSSAEKEKVKMNYNAVMHRNKVSADVVWPRYFDEMTPKEVGLTIAAREGVLPESAEGVARDYYTALKEIRDPQTAGLAIEKLRALSTTVSPATATKVIDQTNAAIQFAEQHIAFLRTRSQYTSEQRYGKMQAVLLDGKGKTVRVSADDNDALLKLVQKQQASGARLLFSDEKQPGQFGGTNEAVISQFENMEQQRALRMQAALKDAPADVQAALLDQGSLANEMRDSLSSLQPLPGTGRKFSAGRETLNMLEQGDTFFGRQSNWMRHKLARASDALARLHPEIAGNLELKKFGDQKLEAFLTPDNEWARKLTSATFFYKLAFEFGNTFLEGFQHLTTGMQQLISETGSVGDAAALTAKASKDFWTAKTTGKWASEEQRLAMKWFAEHGHDQASSWNDIHDPDTMSLRLANSSKGVVGKTLAGVDAAAKKLSGTVQGYGNRIGLLAGFALGRSKGMSFDEATKFAVDSKNLGMYTGGKAQRSGLWRIKTKAVPQLLSSLQTYTQGWFGQMYSDYVRGFSKDRPSGLSKSQIEGSRKAFLYGIAAQATLAGALGLPGIGQGLALLQQASGVDLKGWTRGHLQELFDEDNESGGLITGMAMNGILAGTTPFDPSNRAAIGVPYLGVTSQKGFDISNLAGAPVATAGDFAKGLFAAASGSRVGWETALPNVLRRPARLAADDWDVRDKRGGLLYQLSPAERAMTLLGLPPSRIQRARDVAQAAKNAQDAEVHGKEAMADLLAKMFTEQGPQAVQQRLVQLKQEQPELDLTSLVKSIAQRRVRQTTPYDWRRETNPGAELAGLNVYNPSTAALGRSIQQQTLSALGLRDRPNPQADMEAVAVDHLLNSGAVKTEAEARKLLSRRRKRPEGLEIPGL